MARGAGLPAGGDRCIAVCRRIDRREKAQMMGDGRHDENTPASLPRRCGCARRRRRRTLVIDIDWAKLKQREVSEKRSPDKWS